jgi:hypothetical protein
VKRVLVIKSGDSYLECIYPGPGKTRESCIAWSDSQLAAMRLNAVEAAGLMAFIHVDPAKHERTRPVRLTKASEPAKREPRIGDRVHAFPYDEGASGITGVLVEGRFDKWAVKRDDGEPGGGPGGSWNLRNDTRIEVLS